MAEISFSSQTYRMLKFVLLLMISNLCFAASYFTKHGEFDSFQWSLSRAKNPDFSYDIFYYIPKSLATTKNAPALIFMHGGGDTTMDREGAIKTVQRYAPDLIKLSEEIGFVLILPSSNGLNWGGHTRGFIRDLAGLVRSELKVDPNNMGLSGHSMGGMGMTRTAHWLTDQFSFFVPLAAGMDFSYATEENLISNFNTTYHHQQGLLDEFTMFVERCENQARIVKNLETKYHRSANFTMEFYNGPHNYDRPLYKAALEKYFGTVRRNLYQDHLFGGFNLMNDFRVENKIKFHSNPFAHYFWVEANKYDAKAMPFRFNFEAKVLKNKNMISLKADENIKHIKTLRFYLSHKFIDLKRPLLIEINGRYFSIPEIQTQKNPVMRSLMTIIKLQKQDKGFDYDSFVDIKL